MQLCPLHQFQPAGIAKIVILTQLSIKYLRKFQLVDSNYCAPNIWSAIQNIRFTRFVFSLVPCSHRSLHAIMAVGEGCDTLLTSANSSKVCFATCNSQAQSLIMPILSKVTPPQDAHERFVLQIYPGSNTNSQAQSLIMPIYIYTGPAPGISDWYGHWVCVSVNKLGGLGACPPPHENFCTLRSLLRSCFVWAKKATSPSVVSGSDRTELPEISATHDAHVSPSPIYALVSRSSYRNTKLRSLNSLVATLNA